MDGHFLSSEESARFQSVWFFARTQILQLVPDALEAAIEFRARLGGTTDWQPPRRMDWQEAQFLVRELDRAVLNGRLVLKSEPTFHVHAWHAPQDAEPEATPSPESANPVPEGAWIELELRNPQGEPVAYRPFRVIQQKRVVREGMTNATGFARVEQLAPGICEIEFVDFDEMDFHHQPALPGASPATAAGPVTRSPTVEDPSGEPDAGAAQEFAS